MYDEELEIGEKKGEQETDAGNESQDPLASNISFLKDGNGQEEKDEIIESSGVGYGNAEENTIFTRSHQITTLCYKAGGHGACKVVGRQVKRINKTYESQDNKNKIKFTS